MLSLTSKQLEVFDQQSLLNYINKTVQYFSKKQAALTEAMNNSELEDFIVSMIDKAEGYGIDIEDDVKEYILFSLQLGIDFPDQYDWATATLQDESLLSYEKTNLLKGPVTQAYEQKLAEVND